MIINWEERAKLESIRITKDLDLSQKILLSQSFYARRKLRDVLSAARKNPKRAFGEYRLLRGLLEDLGFPTKKLSNEQIIQVVEEVMEIFGGDWA